MGIIIIGSGLGGLVAGAKLSCEGKKVTVIEKITKLADVPILLNEMALVLRSHFIK
jgi:2-polyprenyl-6-methoxyphenol hydroxylase-like FAD-dependent oxidoreductase